MFENLKNVFSSSSKDEGTGIAQKTGDSVSEQKKPTGIQNSVIGSDETTISNKGIVNSNLQTGEQTIPTGEQDSNLQTGDSVSEQKKPTGIQNSVIGSDETTEKPKLAKPVNPLTDRKKIKFSVSSKGLKDSIECQKGWRDMNKSYSGNLRNCYIHFSAKDKEGQNFRNSFNAYGGLRKTLDSAKNRDSFTNLLDKWLQFNIVESLKEQNENGKFLFGLYDYERAIIDSFDKNGNPVSKSKIYYTGEKDSFNRMITLNVYKKNEQGKHIDIFVPFEKWSINTLFNLLNENEKRIEEAHKMGIEYTEINVCDVPEQGEQTIPTGEQETTISNKGIVNSNLQTGEQTIPTGEQDSNLQTGEQTIPTGETVSNVG